MTVLRPLSSSFDIPSFDISSSLIRGDVSPIRPGTCCPPPPVCPIEPPPKGKVTTPDSFEYTSNTMVSERKLTFNKETNQITDIVTNKKTGERTKQTINIPPERWTPFLQAFNAAGGKSLNGREFIDPNPPADAGGWSMMVNGTKFSGSATAKIDNFDISALLRSLTGSAV